MALLALVVACGLLVGGPSVADAATPPGGEVSRAPITSGDLLSGAAPDGLTVNSRFAPPAGSRAARQPFVGTLRLDGAPMTALTDAPDGVTNPVLGKDTAYLPDVSLSFFTYRDQLVPTTQGVVRNGILPGTRSFWDVVVQPGRVWADPGGHGWNRASFPFALVNSLENETHTGIAVFLYRGSAVSPVRFQIVQQTSPWYVPEFFSAWGVSGAEYERGGIDGLGARMRAHARELAHRLPVRPLSARPDDVPAPEANPDTYVSAVVDDGVLYRSACRTAAGPFPFCDGMRHGMWSVTKSAMMNVAMLRLAEKYGAGLLREPIARYVPGARQPGWRDVTFLDMANMSSGHGEAGDEGSPDYNRWYEALRERPKTAQAFAEDPRTTEPGARFDYRDETAYLLGVALDGYLESREGPRASIWTMLEREVYRPIGIFHAPTNSTVERDGSRGHPLLAFGYYATLDDLAKIAMLYQGHGAWHGRQILHRGLVDGLLPTTTPPADRSPSPEYYLNWWFATSGGWWLPSMEGYGGNTVTLLPADLVTIAIGNEDSGGCVGCGG